jgi:hypothetical protein
LNNENKKIRLAAGALLLVLLLLLLYWIFPIEKDEIHAGVLGGVEKAERYKASTVSQENVALEDGQKSEFFQSAAFQNLAKDPDALQRIFSNDFQQLFNESQELGFVCAANILKKTEAYKWAMITVKKSGLELSDFENMSDEARRGMAFYSTILNNANAQQKQELAQIDFPIIAFLQKNPSLSMVEGIKPPPTIFCRDEDFQEIYTKAIDSFTGSSVFKKLDIEMINSAQIVSFVAYKNQELNLQELSPLAAYTVNQAADLALKNAVNALNAINFQSDAQQLAQFSAANILKYAYKAADGLSSQGTFDANEFNNRLSQLLQATSDPANPNSDIFVKAINNAELARIFSSDMVSWGTWWSRPELQAVLSSNDYHNFMQMNYSAELKQQILKANGFDYFVRN